MNKPKPYCEALVSRIFYEIPKHYGEERFPMPELYVKLMKKAWSPAVVVAYIKKEHPYVTDVFFIRRDYD